MLALLALGGQVKPIPNLIFSPSVLERSQACRTKTSLRVTKCHRAAIFDEAYLGARVRYGWGSRSYRTMLHIPTITSHAFWRSHSIFILQCHLGWCWNLQCWLLQSCQLPNLSHLSSWDWTVCSISSEWPGKPYPQPRPISFNARTLSDMANRNVPKGH